MTPHENNIASAPFDIQVKICSRCNKSKSISDFQKRLKSKDGLNGVCRSCKNGWKTEVHYPRITDKEAVICNMCMLPKLASEFSSNRTNINGLGPYCRECRKVDAKKSSKNRYDADPVKYRERRKKWASSNWISVCLHRCKRRAKQKGILFDLESSDLLDHTGQLPEYCVIFPHIKLDYLGGADRRIWASVDRIVPELGYTKGNVCVISFGANIWKSNGSNEAERKRIIEIMTGSRTDKRKNVVTNDEQGLLFSL